MTPTWLHDYLVVFAVMSVIASLLAVVAWVDPNDDVEREF